MASQVEIIFAIETRVTNYYSAWTIGVTDNPSRRRREHGNPKHWYRWRADSERVARFVEAYFLDKGMKGDVGVGGRADYVYIFR